MGIRSVRSEGRPYNIFYRSRKVFRKNADWFFEDEAGKAFGPFDSKEKTLKAVRIYQDAKNGNLSFNFNAIKQVI